jgi:hypothetical protein
MVPALFATEDAIGTIHYSRFTVLSEPTLLYLADFDGEFGPLTLDLARRAEPLFDAIKAPESLVDPRGAGQEFAVVDGMAKPIHARLIGPAQQP